VNVEPGIGYQADIMLARTFPASSGPSTGSVASNVLRPNGDVQNNFTSSGCASDFDCVNDISSDGDATHLENTHSAYTESSWSLTNPTSTSGVVDSIVASMVIARFSSDNNRKARLVLHTNGGSYNGSEVDVDAVSSYTEYTRTWATNPATGAAFTWAELNSLEIGVDLKKSVKVTQVFVTVYSH
jgi:hypothetical protein